jgi:hypothetical protein
MSWEVSQEQALLACVRIFLDSRYDRGRPEGLRLELHPSVVNMLLTCPELHWELDAPLSDVTRQLSEKFGVPVKVTTELPAAHWRLAIVTEHVLDSGRLTWPLRA